LFPVCPLFTKESLIAGQRRVRGRKIAVARMMRVACVLAWWRTASLCRQASAAWAAVTVSGA
jgi:hypothetical protein